MGDQRARVLGESCGVALDRRLHEPLDARAQRRAEHRARARLRRDPQHRRKLRQRPVRRGLDNAHAHQLLAAVQYWLSKRTMVYVAGIHQRASHGGNAQINGVMDANGASSGALQSIARLGFSTRF